MQGHNNPPPVETHSLHIEDLYDNAKGILDGAGVQTEADAEMVAKLLTTLREARKAADEQRAIEKKPHDDAGKAVQTAWKPLLDKCDLAASVCKQALTPFQVRKEAEQRAIADAARKDAEERQAAATAALRASSATDLAAREEAEQLLKQADRATKDAARLDKARPNIAGGGRAIGLRTSYRAEVTDLLALGKWAWTHRRADYEAFLIDLAERESRNGPVSIPGVIIHTERKAA